MNLLEWLHRIAWTIIILMGIYFGYVYIVLVKAIENYYVR